MNTVQYNTIRKGQVQTQYDKSKEIKNMLKEKHAEKKVTQLSRMVENEKRPANCCRKLQNLLLT